MDKGAWVGLDLEEHAAQNEAAIRNKPKLAKYPDDFEAFNAKELTTGEIDLLIQKLLSSDDTLALHTGNIAVKLTSWGGIQVWQLIAKFNPPI